MTYRPVAASRTRAAVVVPIGPGIETALDTLESVDAYCPEPHQVIIVDDHTSDGTYEALMAAKKSNWTVLRNERPLRLERLVHTLCVAFRHVLDSTTCELVLRLDQDALLIKPGVLSEGLDYMAAHRNVGLFGVYEVDYNRPRNWEGHRRRITQETGWFRRISGRSAFYLPFLREAERRGYIRGDNVYGGAYWITRACLEEMRKMTALDSPSQLWRQASRWVTSLFPPVPYAWNRGDCHIPRHNSLRAMPRSCIPWTRVRTRTQPLMGASQRGSFSGGCGGANEQSDAGGGAARR